MGKLYLVPTQIGNLKDITFRAIEVLKEVDFILAEDTRTSGKLLKYYEITTPMQSHHMHNEHKTDVLSLIGMEYLFLEDFENAKKYFIQCLFEDSEDFSALYNIIYCFEYLNQTEEAIEYLNGFLNKNPYCEVAWHQVGKQYFLLKEYRKALAAFDFAIISDDRFIGAYLEKGKVLEKLNRYNEAIESYTVTLGLDDPTSFALLRIGKCYENLGNSELALQVNKIITFPLALLSFNRFTDVANPMPIAVPPVIVVLYFILLS